MRPCRRLLSAGATCAATMLALGVAAPPVLAHRTIRGRAVRRNAAALPCKGNPATVHTLTLTIPRSQRTTGLHDGPGSVASGIYVLPSGRPRGLVVFAHGHNNTPEGAWETHMRRTAASDHVIAVAMDYYDPTPPHPLPAGVSADTYGWRVAEGADFSVAAARAFAAACHPRTIVMYGVSMGGETAGLAVAERARRPHSRRPLFDELFDIEGVANVAETYLEAAATQNYAQGEIEEEMGGSPAQVPQAYAQRTLVDRAGDIAASGVRGVVIVQAVDDGLVPYDQNREFNAVLAAHGVPVDFFTVGMRGRVDTAHPNPLNLTDNPGCADANDCQTTADGYVTGSVPGFVSPFAGHGWEGSTTQDVIMTGFARLDALFQHGAAPSGEHQYFVDPNVGTVPSPAS